jgi:hypothetical protein
VRHSTAGADITSPQRMHWIALRCIASHRHGALTRLRQSSLCSSDAAVRSLRKSSLVLRAPSGPTAAAMRSRRGATRSPNRTRGGHATVGDAHRLRLYRNWRPSMQWRWAGARPHAQAIPCRGQAHGVAESAKLSTQRRQPLRLAAPVPSRAGLGVLFHVACCMLQEA